MGNKVAKEKKKVISTSVPERHLNEFRLVRDIDKLCLYKNNQFCIELKVKELFYLSNDSGKEVMLDLRGNKLRFSNISRILIGFKGFNSNLNGIPSDEVILYLETIGSDNYDVHDISNYLSQTKITFTVWF